MLWANTTVEHGTGWLTLFVIAYRTSFGCVYMPLTSLVLCGLTLMALLPVFLAWMRRMPTDVLSPRERAQSLKRCMAR